MQKSWGRNECGAVGIPRRPIWPRCIREKEGRAGSILLHKDIIHRQDSVLPVSLEVLFSIEKKKATSLWSVLLIQFSLTVPNSEFEIVQYKNITDDKTTLNAQVLLLVYTYEDSILSYVSFKPCSLQESIKWDYLKF